MRDSGWRTRGFIRGTFARLVGPLTSSSRGAPRDPRKLTARYRLGELAYLLGDLPAARRSLEEFSAATADHAGLEMALTYLGDTCFGLQDFAQARGGLPAVARGVSQGEACGTSEVWPGADSGGARRARPALALMQELTRQGNPEWIDRAWLQIGLIRKSAGQFAEAVEAFTTLERAAPAEPATARGSASARAGLGAARAYRGGRTALKISGGRRGRSPGRAGRARAGDARARAQPARRGHDHARDGPEAISGVAFAAGHALSSRRGSPEAKPPGGSPGAVRAGGRVQSQRSLGRRCAAAGRPGGPGPGRSGGGPAPGRYVRGPVSPEPAQVGGPADRGPRRRAARASTTRPSRCSSHSSTRPADATKKPATALPHRLEPGRPLRVGPCLTGPWANPHWPIRFSPAWPRRASGPVAADAQFLIGQSHLTAGRYAEAVPRSRLTWRPTQGRCRRCRAGSSRGGASGLGQLDQAWKTLADSRRTISAQPVFGADPATACRGRTGRASGRAGRRAVPAGCRRRRHRRTSLAKSPGTEIERPDGAGAANSSAGGPGKGRSVSWASRPTRPRPSPPCSSWPPPTRSRRRSRWPRAAHSRPTNRSMPPSKPIPLFWKSLRNRTRHRKPPWPRLGSSPRPVAAMRPRVHSSV